LEAYGRKEEEMRKEEKKKVNGFVKFLLFALTVGFLVAMLMSVMLTAFPRKAHAERQTSLKDGTLTVWADVMKVPGVPKEITDPEIAFKLYTGQLKEAVVTRQGETTYHLGFPWIKERTTYTENIVTCSDGKWFLGPAIPKSAESNLYLISCFMFFMLVMLILFFYVGQLIWNASRPTTKAN